MSAANAPSPPAGTAAGAVVRAAARAPLGRAGSDAHRPARPARGPEGARRRDRDRRGAGRRAPAHMGRDARALLHGARARDARRALRPHHPARRRPRGTRARRPGVHRRAADGVRPARPANLRGRPVQQPEPVSGPRHRDGIAAPAAERVPAFRSAHAPAGAPVARGDLRVGQGARRGLRRRRRGRSAGRASHRVPRRAEEGGPGGAGDGGETVRRARGRGPGPRPARARRRGVSARPAAGKRDLRRHPDPAHARGLLRGSGVRRQPARRRLAPRRPRGRQPAARLLALRHGHESHPAPLRAAARSSDVDAESRRAPRTVAAHPGRTAGAADDPVAHGAPRRVTAMARRHDDVLGAPSLARFDVCIVGSGAGGGTAAYVLTRADAGKNVLVLEAGANPFPDLDRAGDLPPTLHSNDELKYAVRGFIDQDPFLEPRTFRQDATRTATLNADVNTLPKAVGGAFQHADCKTPRFNAVDFRLKSAVEALIGTTPGLAVPGFGADAGSASFTDWPVSYDDLEPFYVEAERLYGVQGLAGANVYESPRSGPYPMPPGVPMYLALRLADGARQVDLFEYGKLHPHPYPASITSAPYDGRPPCVDCGLSSGFGCPNHAKGSPAVTALRKALLTGRCQLRFNCHVTKLVNDGGRVTAVQYVDGAGKTQQATADAFILAASPIESARLCFLSPTPAGAVLGNRSDQVGRNLMFHAQTNVNGFSA